MADTKYHVTLTGVEEFRKNKEAVVQMAKEAEQAVAQLNKAMERFEELRQKFNALGVTPGELFQTEEERG